MRTPEDILRGAKTIAVVGLSDDPQRESYGVASYLQRQGYRIIPVNPSVKSVLGETSYATLLEIPVAVDLVDVFRRAETTVPMARDAVAIGAKAFWLQLGIVNEEAASVARAGGLDVVMDACTMIVHARMCRGGEGSTLGLRVWPGS